MGLLSGLENVDWQRYHHAYGPATDVPDLLRALAVPESAPSGIRVGAERKHTSVFDEVCWLLWGNVFHQGTRWGVTSHVVPFLRELLVAGPPRVELRRFLVRYLHHLARGYPEDEFPQPFDLGGVLAECARVEALEPPAWAVAGDVFGHEDEDTQPGDSPVPTPPDERAEHDWANEVFVLWVRDCFVAVEACVPDVLPLVRDEDDELAFSALGLLASFPRRGPEVAAELWSLVHATDAREGRRGAALVVLAQHGADIAHTAQVMLDEVTGLDATYVACAEVLAKQGDASPFSWARLLDVPETMGARDCPFAGTVSRLVSECLSRSTPEVEAAALERLRLHLPEVPSEDRPHLAEAMLRLAFKGPAPQPSQWSPTQCVVIDSVLTHVADELVHRGLFGVLRELHLPTEPAALRQALSVARAPRSPR